jgi:transposase
MKKSFEGLSSIVETLFPTELLTGAFFVFINRRKDCMKVLFWDNDGFVIWYKRLEKGVFSKQLNTATLTRREFLMLLEGITPKRLEKRYQML